MFCGPRYYCPDCKAKGKNFGRHCPAGVVALTKICREIHLETFLLRLETNTFCGQAQDLYITIDRYFWTKAELDAIKSVWAVDGTSHFAFRRLTRLKEVTVSATKVVCDFGELVRKVQGQVLVDKMTQELAASETRSSQPKVQYIGAKEQGEKSGIAWELSPTPSVYVCRRCGMTGHWLENCPRYNFVHSAAWYYEQVTRLRQGMRG